MYDDVLSKRILDLECSADTDSDYGDGNGGFKYLTDFQAEVGGCGAEYDCKDYAESDGISRYLTILPCRMHKRSVVFVGSQLAECVFG